MAVNKSRRLAIAAALLVLVGAASARADDSSFISKAVFADSTLWILTDTGTLSAIRENGDQRDPVVLGAKVIGLAVQSGQPVAIACELESCPAWDVYRLQEGTWKKNMTVLPVREDLVDISADDSAFTIVTSRRIITIKGGERRVKTVKSAAKAAENLIISFEGVSTIFATPEAVFVGGNYGEWGGSLNRINRSTGAQSVLRSIAKKGGGTDPYRASIDPINGFAPIPWKPGCVAAAVGMVHFSSHGRIIEICGNQVKRLYFKQFGEDARKFSEKDDEPYSTVAFFGIVATGDSLTAAGIDGLHRIAADGTAKVDAFPAFREIDGVHVSFAQPGLVLVLTHVNARMSVSGAVPLLVAR